MARGKRYGPYNYERKLGQRDYTLVTDIEDIIATVDKRLTAVARQSFQDLVEDMQTPVAKGGKMRVKTGFLRASGQASLNGMPTGPSQPASDGPQTYRSPDDYSTVSSVALALAQLKIGATIFFGWTANYAKYREAYDGFLEAAIQNWQKYVTKNTELVKSRIKK